MFYSISNFKDIGFDHNTADAAAKHCNSLIDDNGQVLHGNVLEDGSYINFTSERKPTDTHVLIGIGTSETGLFDNRSKPIKKEKLTQAQVDSVFEKHNRKLETENDFLRKKNGIT